jgi:hypothetical protein
MGRMTKGCLRLLGYSALFVSCVAGLMAILPAVLWFYAGALANDLMARSDNCD